MAPASTLRIELKPSLRLATWLAASHTLALFAAWASFSGWPLCAVAAGVLASAAWLLPESLHCSDAAALSLEIREDGGAAWQDRRGEWHQARLGGSHFVAAGLIVAELRHEGGRRKWLVLLPDAAAPEDLRRLRLWLRWRRAPDSETGIGPTGFK